MQINNFPSDRAVEFNKDIHVALCSMLTARKGPKNGNPPDAEAVL